MYNRIPATPGSLLGVALFFLTSPAFAAAPPDTAIDVDRLDQFGHPAICAATDSQVATLGDQRISAQCVYLWRIAHGSAPVMAPGDGDISGLYGDGLAVNIESIDKSSVGIAGLPVLTNLEQTPEMAVIFGAVCAALFWAAIVAGKSA